MKVRRAAVAVLAAAAAFGMAGCGLGQQAAETAAEQLAEQQLGDGSNVEINEDGSVKIEGEDGTFEAGTGNLPEGWPADVPVPDGFTVYGGAVDTASGTATAIFEAPGDATAQVEAYVASLESAGWTPPEGAPALPDIYPLENGDRTMSIIVSRETDKTSMAVTVLQQQQ
jgi:hypothetical protein